MKIVNNFLIFFFLFLTSNLYADLKHKSLINLTKEEREYLNQKEVLRVSNLNNFPPFNYNRNNKALGYSVDYIKLMGEHLGINVEFALNKTWAQNLSMLSDGTLDVIPHIARNKEREKFLDFTSFNHIFYSIGFVSRKNLSIKSVEQLNSLKLAVTKKTFLHTHFKDNFPNVKLVLTKTTNDALDLLINNEVDVVVGNLPSLNFFIQEKWMNNLITFTLNDLGMLLEVNLPMGVQKGNTLLKSILEKANDSITPSEIAALKTKWFSSSNANSLKTLSENELEYLKSKQEIKMCIDPDWMPFEKIQDGKHIGMSADYIKIFEENIQVPIKLVPSENWTESLEFGKQRKCDIFSLVMPTKERRKHWDFTQAYMHVPLVVSTKINEFFINDITSVTNKKLGIVKNYAFVEILKERYPNINLIEVDNINEGLQRVDHGELFGFIGTLYSVGYAIQNEYVSKLKIAGKFDETWDLGIGVRNDEPILTSIFNKAIENIRTSDNHEILNKWISVNYEKGIDYTKLWQVSSALILIILVVLYKNRTISLVNRQLVKANNEIKEQQEMVDKYVLIVNTDLKGFITSANPAYTNATGFSKNELIGKKHNIMRHPDMSDEFFVQMWKKLKSNQAWDGEIKNYTKNGEICWFNTYIEPLYENNKKVGYRSINEDITDKKRIEELSITDKLTGLYNRLKLDEILNIQIQEYKRYNHKFSIILLDVDDFKNINDNYGHDVGDKVLQKLSDILKKNIRVTDVIGRWGGEEFVVVCKNTCSENAAILADHLRLLVESEKFENLDTKTISLGVTQFSEDDNVSSLFKRADDALYLAKKSGKNKVIVI